MAAGIMQAAPYDTSPSLLAIFPCHRPDSSHRGPTDGRSVTLTLTLTLNLT